MLIVRMLFSPLLPLLAWCCVCGVAQAGLPVRVGLSDLPPLVAMGADDRPQGLFVDQSVISNEGQVFVAQGSSIQSLPDLKNRRIADWQPDEDSLYHHQPQNLLDRPDVGQILPRWVLQVLAIAGIGLAILLSGTVILRWRIKAHSHELSQSEKRYRALFEGTAVSLWEEDLSEVMEELQRLQASGVTDIHAYFEQDPARLSAFTQRIRVIAVNPSTLSLFGADSLQQLQQGQSLVSTPSATGSFAKALIAMSRQQEHFTDETEFRTLQGRPIMAMISFQIPANREEARHVAVSVLDVTQQRTMERQLSRVIEGASLGFWDWELQTGRHKVNDRWLQMLGLQRDDIKNHVSDWQGRIHPDDRNRIEPIVMQHIRQGLSYLVEYRMRHKDGHWVWIQGSGGGVEYAPQSNEPIRACGTHQDITARKRSEDALHTLVESTVGISGADFFERVTRELCRWFEADGANIGKLTADNHIRALCTIMNGEIIEDFEYHLSGTPCDQVLDKGPCLYTHNVCSLFPEDKLLADFNIDGYAGTPIRNQTGDITGVIWVVSRQPLQMPPQWEDILAIIAARTSAEIERLHSMQQLEHQATFDALTDLPNRRLLLDRLRHAQALCRRHGHKGAVLFIDLDHFKSINDSLGHTIGDELLKQVARRLQNELRDEDTPARLGGDEFVILFSELSDEPQLAAQQAQQGAAKIQKALSQPYTIQGNELHITPSIGLVIFPMDDQAPDDILRHADTAMYLAKEAGRNTIRFFLPIMQQQAQEQLRLKFDLRNALAKHQFSLFYQPQMDANGRIIGAETLLRWSHPERGRVPPDDFIPVAEQDGQILAIGKWVLEEALKQLAQWLANGHDALRQLSVNLSPVQFHQADFTDEIERILAQTGIAPHYLTLELTEGTLVENLEAAKQKITRLNQLGVRFSIDDFGTGYASIAYLRRLPLDELKIDRSFVRDILSDPKDANLVETIITMARQMQLGLVAEGVETEAQFLFLRDKGCNIFQGMHFGAPRSAREFTAELSRHAKTSGITS